MGSWAYVQYSYHLDGQEKNLWTANCGNRKKMAVMKNVRIRLENLKMDIIWIDFGSGEYRRERKNTEKQKNKAKSC